MGRGKSIPQFRWYQIALQLGKDDPIEVMETKRFSFRQASLLTFAAGFWLGHHRSKAIDPDRTFGLSRPRNCALTPPHIHGTEHTVKRCFARG
jgi:hypothetical protein